MELARVTLGFRFWRFRALGFWSFGVLGFRVKAFRGLEIILPQLKRLTFSGPGYPGLLLSFGVLTAVPNP